MDLNAYVWAMAIAGAPRQQKNRQTVPEPEFKPFDRCLGSLYRSGTQRQNGEMGRIRIS
jgi:hypothetical protein